MKHKYMKKLSFISFPAQTRFLFKTEQPSGSVNEAATEVNGVQIDSISAAELQSDFPYPQVTKLAQVLKGLEFGDLDGDEEEFGNLHEALDDFSKAFNAQLPNSGLDLNFSGRGNKITFSPDIITALEQYVAGQETGNELGNLISTVLGAERAALQGAEERAHLTATKQPTEIEPVTLDATTEPLSRPEIVVGAESYGAQTWEQLKGKPKNTADKARKEQLQTDLLNAGFDPQGVDGWPGNKTLKALDTYAQALGVGRDAAITQLYKDSRANENRLAESEAAYTGAPFVRAEDPAPSPRVVDLGAATNPEDRISFEARKTPAEKMSEGLQRAQVAYVIGPKFTKPGNEMVESTVKDYLKPDGTFTDKINGSTLGQFVERSDYLRLTDQGLVRPAFAIVKSNGERFFVSEEADINGPNRVRVTAGDKMDFVLTNEERREEAQQNAEAAKQKRANDFADYKQRSVERLKNSPIAKLIDSATSGPVAVSRTQLATLLDDKWDNHGLNDIPENADGFTLEIDRAGGSTSYVKVTWETGEPNVSGNRTMRFRHQRDFTNDGGAYLVGQYNYRLDWI